MHPPDRPPADRLIRWGYWIVLALLAVGAARTLFRLARGWGWI